MRFECYIPRTRVSWLVLLGNSTTDAVVVPGVVDIYSGIVETLHIPFLPVRTRELAHGLAIFNRSEAFGARTNGQAT